MYMQGQLHWSAVHVAKMSDSDNVPSSKENSPEIEFQQKRTTRNRRVPPKLKDVDITEDIRCEPSSKLIYS